MQDDPKMPERPLEEPGYTPDEIVPDQGDVIYPGAIPDNQPESDPDD